MSVGICIINHNGIALAADSAGTVGRNSMFYNSMNKVFSISKRNILGAITYGSTRINDVLIDQIIKEFRLYIDNTVGEIRDVDDLEQCLNEYITKNDGYYNFTKYNELECEGMVMSLLNQWRQRIDKSIVSFNNQTNNDSNSSAEELKDVLSPLMMVINKLEEEIKKTNQNCFINYVDDINTFLSDIIEKCICSTFANIDLFDEEKKKLYNLLLIHLNLEFNKTNPLGLFIAGYGSESAFPKFFHLSIYRVVGGKLKYTVVERGPKGNDIIIPLAQPEVILTFCKCISNDLQNIYDIVLGKTINNRIEELDSTIFNEQQKEILKKQFGVIPQQINATINGYIQQKNVDPLFLGLKYLPLPEMASLAENLINITTLRRRYVLDGNQQTVGGPTDVAVLSKGDGFIWIKRKHYFEKDLNRQYFEK